MGMSLVLQVFAHKPVVYLLLELILKATLMCVPQFMTIHPIKVEMFKLKPHILTSGGAE